MKHICITLSLLLVYINIHANIHIHEVGHNTNESASDGYVWIYTEGDAGTYTVYLNGDLSSPCEELSPNKFYCGGLASGDYSILVIDKYNCETWLDFTINTACGLEVYLEEVQNVTQCSVVECLNDGEAPCTNDGSATIKINQDNYESIIWKNFAGDVIAEDVMSVFGLSPGFYIVEVEGHDGCQITSYVYIDNCFNEVPFYGGGCFPGATYEDITIELIRKTSTNDIEPYTGSVDINVIGGYRSLYWTSEPDGTIISNNEDIYGMPPGEYWVHVSNGCEVYSQGYLILTCDSEIDYDLSVMSIEGCSPTQVNFNHLYGNNDIEYIIDPPEDFTIVGNAIVGLPAGSYTLTLVDNICFNQSNINFEVEEAILDPIVIEDHVRCVIPNYSNGSIVTTDISGGDPPYSYRWNNGSTQPNLFTQQPGDYSLTVTDEIGCSAVKNYTIGTGSENPVDAEINLVNINDQCEEEVLISATAEVNSGNGPFKYIWEINVPPYRTTLTGNPIFLDVDGGEWDRIPVRLTIVDDCGYETFIDGDTSCPDFCSDDCITMKHNQTLIAALKSCTDINCEAPLLGECDEIEIVCNCDDGVRREVSAPSINSGEIIFEGTELIDGPNSIELELLGQLGIHDYSWVNDVTKCEYNGRLILPSRCWGFWDVLSDIFIAGSGSDIDTPCHDHQLEFLGSDFETCEMFYFCPDDPDEIIIRDGEEDQCYEEYTNYAGSDCEGCIPYDFNYRVITFCTDGVNTSIISIKDKENRPGGIDKCGTQFLNLDSSNTAENNENNPPTSLISGCGNLIDGFYNEWSESYFFFDNNKNQTIHNLNLVNSSGYEHLENAEDIFLDLYQPDFIELTNDTSLVYFGSKNNSGLYLSKINKLGLEWEQEIGHAKGLELFVNQARNIVHIIHQNVNTLDYIHSIYNFNGSLFNEFTSNISFENQEFFKWITDKNYCILKNDNTDTNLLEYKIKGIQESIILPKNIILKDAIFEDSKIVFLANFEGTIQLNGNVHVSEDVLSSLAFVCDDKGEIIYSESYSESTNQIAKSIIKGETDYLIAGYVYSGNADNFNSNLAEDSIKINEEYCGFLKIIEFSTMNTSLKENIDLEVQSNYQVISALEIFPNPFENNFNMKFNNQDLYEEIECRIISVNGEIIENKILKVKKGINVFMIDVLQSFPDGIYMIQLSNNGTPIAEDRMIKVNR